MDESTSRLTRQERSVLRQMEEDLAREDPRFASALGRSQARQYTWPRLFRLRARVYLAAGLGLVVLAAVIHQTFTLLAALICFGAAVARTLHDA